MYSYIYIYIYIYNIYIYIYTYTYILIFLPLRAFCPSSGAPTRRHSSCNNNTYTYAYTYISSNTLKVIYCTPLVFHRGDLPAAPDRAARSAAPRTFFLFISCYV